MVSSLQNAGDAMLQAVIYHSDNLELSEQFDGVSGYEKSVNKKKRDRSNKRGK